MGIKELRVSEKINSGFDLTESFVPLKGQRFKVLVFEASCPDSSLATARIEYGNDILWVIQRDSTMFRKIEIIGDGVQEIKLICENSCSDDYYFNAYLKMVNK